MFDLPSELAIKELVKVKKITITSILFTSPFSISSRATVGRLEVLNPLRSERADHGDIGRSVGELLACDGSEGVRVGLELQVELLHISIGLFAFHVVAEF